MADKFITWAAEAMPDDGPLSFLFMFCIVGPVAFVLFMIEASVLLLPIIALCLFGL